MTAEPGRQTVVDISHPRALGDFGDSVDERTFGQPRDGADDSDRLCQVLVGRAVERPGRGGRTDGLDSLREYLREAPGEVFHVSILPRGSDIQSLINAGKQHPAPPCSTQRESALGNLTERPT